MRKSIRFGMAATLASIFVLAGCNEPEPDPEASGVTPGLIAEPSDSAPVETTENAPAPATETSVIPAQYQGVWDYEGGTCALESDMRMSVTPTDITYYESYGTVTGVRPEGDELIVDLAMEGEGDQWQESQRLSIIGSGTAKRLHVTNGEQPKVVDEYPRKSCEG